MLSHFRGTTFVETAVCSGATRQVCRDLLTYYQLLFPPPSLAILKFNQIQAENLLKHQLSSDSRCGQLIFYCENVQLITDSMGI